MARTTSVTSFAIEVRRNLRLPMLRYLTIWCAVSAVITIVTLCGVVNVAVASLCGSLLSLVGTMLILFSGITASKNERKNYQFIYCLSICDMLFALKMTISAVMIISGLSLEWQDAHAAWCYPAAIVDAFCVTAGLGWNFVILLDIVLIVFYPLKYGAQKHKYIKYYHMIVWPLATIMCIPPLVAGAIGVADITCWVTGVYQLPFYSVRYLYLIFALIGVSALYYRLNIYHENTAQISTSFVRVVVQSALITYSFASCWFWLVVFLIWGAVTVVSPVIFMLTVFWLGAVGFSNSIIWLPFIVKAINKARGIQVTETSQGDTEGWDTHEVHVSSDSAMPSDTLHPLHLGRNDSVDARIR